MREVLLLAFFGCIAVLCRDTYALQDPSYIDSSGSGDEEPSVVSNTGPTNATRLTLGDDSDYGSGSATTEASTEQETTTVTQTTTEQTTTKTTAQPTTTRRMTTDEHITTTKLATVKTDDDDYSGSGSGSGSSGYPTTDSIEMSTKPTTSDIFIDVRTTDNTVIIDGKRGSSTPDDTTTRSTSRPETTQRSKNTKMPSTASSIVRKTTTLPTTRLDSTMMVQADMDSTTKKQTEKTVKPSAGQPKYTTESKEESTGRPTKKVYEHTTKKSEDRSTASDPHVLNQHGDQEEGFTLTTEVIAGVVACALLALLLIAFLMYRLKKRDEGSYLLDESSAYPSDYKKLHPSDKEAFI